MKSDYEDAEPSDEQMGGEGENTKGYPEITLPAGVKLEGDSGDAMVNWQRNPDGTVCLTSFEGQSLAASDEQPEESGPTPYDEIDEMAES